MDISIISSTSLGKISSEAFAKRLLTLKPNKFFCSLTHDFDRQIAKILIEGKFNWTACLSCQTPTKEQWPLVLKANRTIRLYRDPESSREAALGAHGLSNWLMAKPHIVFVSDGSDATARQIKLAVFLQKTVSVFEVCAPSGQQWTTVSGPIQQTLF